MAMATSGELARVLSQTTINASEPSPTGQLATSKPTTTQRQLNAVGKPVHRRVVPRPVGWPPQSLLHTLEASDLYDLWHTSRQEGILNSQKTEPSTCPVPGVGGKFIPSRWVTEWNSLYMEYLKERSKHKTIETDSVVDAGTFKKWWSQPKRPESVSWGLLQYSFPEPGEVPQWPTLSQAQVKAAFTRLVQTPAVLEIIRDALEELVEFDEMLRIQWEYFDQLNEMHGLPPIEPHDRLTLLRLPNQPYEPGAQPFQSAKPKKKVDWGTTPPALPGQSPVAASTLQPGLATASTSQPAQNPPSPEVVGGVIPGITISTRTPYASALKTPRPALNQIGRAHV